MIAIDTNLLVYAHRRDSPFHGAAAAVVAGLATGPDPWAIPWPCLFEFHAVVTHPRIYTPPSTVEQALDQLDAWLEAPGIRLLAEPSGHWPAVRNLVVSARIEGPAVHDARIVALCRAHGVRELWSADRDFSRFRGLRVRNPIAR